MDLQTRSRLHMLRMATCNVKHKCHKTGKREFFFQSVHYSSYITPLAKGSSASVTSSTVCHGKVQSAPRDNSFVHKATSAKLSLAAVLSTRLHTISRAHHEVRKQFLHTHTHPEMVHNTNFESTALQPLPEHGCSLDARNYLSEVITK